MWDRSSQDGVAKLLSQEEIRADYLPNAPGIEVGALLAGEYSVDAEQVVRSLEQSLLAAGGKIIPGWVKSIRRSGDSLFVLTTDGSEKRTDLVVVAAGWGSTEVLPPGSVMPMFEGVGSALVFSDVESRIPQLARTVIRTMNRGGAQCGIHLVPRGGSKYYLGAGNYVREPGPALHRLETLRYLIASMEDELLGVTASYEFVGQPVTGYRPRSLDGHPLIGPLASMPGVFVATAMNRLGFTWAPAIAEEMLRWAQDLNYSPAFPDWMPDRAPISFGSRESALSYFIESRIGAAVEHRLASVSDDSLNAKRQEVELVGEALFERVHDMATTTSSVIHPDNWSAISGKRPDVRVT